MNVIVLIVLFFCQYIVVAFSMSNNDSSSHMESITLSSKSPNSTLLTLKIGKASKHSCCVRSHKTNNIRKYVIIVPISSSYFNLLLNWLAYYHQLCSTRSHIILMCLDKDTERLMNRYGLFCSYSFSYSGNFSKLWIARVALANHFLQSNVDVLFSDVDSFWLQNPFLDLEAFDEADMIASRGTFPNEFSNHYGASICFGFMYVKATNASKLVWNDLKNYMLHQRYPDDQKSLNLLLMEQLLKFNNRLKLDNNYEPDIGHCHVQDQSFQITLLPQESYRRMCSLNDPKNILLSTVVHCLSQKSGIAKENILKSSGLWLLKPNFTNYSPIKDNFDEYLKSVVLIN